MTRTLANVVGERAADTVTIEQWVIVVFIVFLAYMLGWLTLYLISSRKRKNTLKRLEEIQLKRREKRYENERKGDRRFGG